MYKARELRGSIDACEIKDKRRNNMQQSRDLYESEVRANTHHHYNFPIRVFYLQEKNTERMKVAARVNNLLQKFNNRSFASNYCESEMIRKILVAIDGSSQANRALDFAFDIAQKYSSEVMLLAVVPPVFLPLPSLNVMKSQAVADASAELERCFSAVVSKAEEKAKKINSLHVFTVLKHGNPDEIIIETAESGKFDIIVMGSRGYRGYALGSVSSRVAEKATCPILIVK